MNRQQRRAEGKKGKQPTYNLTPSQLQAMVKEQIADTIAVDVKLATYKTLAAVSVALHDEFGFGPKRIQQMTAKVDYIMDCVHAGTVTLNDLYGWCRDYGVNFEEEANGKNQNVDGINQPNTD